MDISYNVIFSGQIADGYHLDSVVASVAKLFKLNLEKAQILFSGKRHILRKSINIQTAHKYKSALEKVGALVELQPVQKLKSEPTELSLVPMSGEQAQPTANISSVDQALAVNNVVKPEPTAVFQCPKCDVEQQENDECINCGIIFSKFFARNPMPAPASGQSIASENSAAEDYNEETTDVSDHGINLKAIGAAATAAILGAFLWKMIAIAFDVELGLIAWGVGGAIGFAAAMFGSRGQTAGVICGLLAVLSIFGGKYWAYETLKNEMTSIALSGEMADELKPLYEEEKLIAQIYSEQATGSPSVREFIVEYEYTEAQSPQQVTSDELSFFNHSVAPRLERLASDSLSYEEWIQQTFGQLEDISTIELLKEDIGAIDILFLILGIGTAFRLASGMQR